MSSTCLGASSLCAGNAQSAEHKKRVELVFAHASTPRGELRVAARVGNGKITVLLTALSDKLNTYLHLHWREPTVAKGYECVRACLRKVLLIYRSKLERYHLLH